MTMKGQSKANSQSTKEGASALIPGGVWELLRQRLNPTAFTPQPDHDVIARELSDRRGPYYVLKNTREKTYLRLSPAEYSLWQRMDGRTSAQELIVDHYLATRSFAHDLVLRLIDQLYRQRMLSTPPVQVWSQLNKAVQRRSWLNRLSYPAQALLMQRLALRGVDRVVEGIYRLGGRWLFWRPLQALFILISLLGLLAFTRILNDPRYVFLGGDVIQGLALLWIASILPVVVHELGHALTVKHYGREVPKGGLMLYFGMPAAFVETTDIWLEPRRARLAVTWNGPYTGLILGGLAGLLMYLFPEATYNHLLFKMAGFAYLTVFFNVNPLLKLDGYYLLSDALDIPMLRERSLAFVRQRLLPKLAQRRKFSREEVIYTAFGLLSAAWSIYALYLAGFFWQARLRAGLQTLLGRGYPLFARVLSLLLVAALVSFVILMLLNLYRLAQLLADRYVRSGGLERHTRLALVCGGVALVAGTGLPLVFPAYARLVVPLAGGLATFFAGGFLLGFNRPYLGSLRGLAQLAFAAALFLAGCSLLSGLFPGAEPVGGALRMTALVSLIVGSLFLIWRPVIGMSPGLPLAGGLAGAIWYFFLLGLVPGNSRIESLALSALVVAAGVLGFLVVRGGGRAPAVTLLFLGGTTLSLESLWPLQPAGLFSLAGALSMAVGALHLILARLPDLTIGEATQVRDRAVHDQTQEIMRASVETLVQRVASQVSFESGWLGVGLLGRAFSQKMRRAGLEIAIDGDRFIDPKLAQRTVDELTGVYTTTLDTLYRLIREQLGRGMGALAFGRALDHLAWQDREVIAEVVLSRLPWGRNLNQKVSDIKAQRRSLLKRVPLFVDMTDQELDRVAGSLSPERFGAGETVVRQGEAGEKFYVIEQGSASVWQVGEDGLEVKLNRLGPGQYFGEAALVTHAPRNATVRAETPLALLSLDHDEFDRLVKQHVDLARHVNTAARNGWLLRGMPIFDDIGSDEIDQLASRLETENFTAGQVIFYEGDAGDKFFLVEAGELAVLNRANGKTVEIARRGPGEYVGEIALLMNTPRTSTIVSVTDSTLLSLRREHFLELVSSYTHLGQALSRTGSRRLSFLGRRSQPAQSAPILGGQTV
jgi:putative peptide zinc metalloprotease protein